MTGQRARLTAVRVAWVFGLAFLANLVLASVLGTALMLVGALVGEARVESMPGLAGVAGVMLYGLAFTAVPAFSLTTVGHLELFALLFSPLRRSRTGWLAAGCVLGEVSGLVSVLWMHASGEYLPVGVVVGGVCGMTQAALWWRGICTRLPAVP